MSLFFVVRLEIYLLLLISFLRSLESCLWRFIFALFFLWIRWNLIRAFCIVSPYVKTLYLLGPFGEQGLEQFLPSLQVCHIFFLKKMPSNLPLSPAMSCLLLWQPLSNNLVRKYDVTICLILFSRGKTSTQLPKAIRAQALFLLVLMFYKIVHTCGRMHIFGCFL